MEDVATNDLSELDLPFCDSPSVPLTDRDILVILYNATGGDNWAFNTNWLTDAPLGEWHGVITDSDGYVSHLGLYNNQLIGPIPPELGRLN